MKLFILLAIVVVTLFVGSEALPFLPGLPPVPGLHQLPLQGLPLSLPGGHGGVPVLGANPFTGFPVFNTSSTQTYNPATNRYAVNNQYVAQGQTRDADVLGVNVLAVPHVLAGLGPQRY